MFSENNSKLYSCCSYLSFQLCFLNLPSISLRIHVQKLVSERVLFNSQNGIAIIRSWKASMSIYRIHILPKIYCLFYPLYNKPVIRRGRCKWRRRARVFRGKGCHESSKMESGSWRDCCQIGIDLTTPIYGDKPGSKLDWLIDWIMFRRKESSKQNYVY